jgi:ABC-type ATPase with predicted acetyltransferase domain
VIKGGGAQSFFGKQSPGEQVRLRIAVVIALLRVGARLGISTHPGLVLIDSPKAEEVQDFDAAVVFKELAELAASNHIQVLITTADRELSKAVLPADCLVTAEEGAPLW